MNAPSFIIVAVDRIEGSKAVLESDSGEQFTVSVRSIKPAPREGRVYRVPIDASGKPVWTSAVADDAEEAKRKKEFGARMEHLRKGDNGGDIKI